MDFKLPEYNKPDFSLEKFKWAPNISLKEVLIDGVPPQGFHLTTALPEYYKIDDQWILPHRSVPFCCVVYNEDNKEFKFLECGDVKVGDMVVISPGTDGSRGVYGHRNAFPEIDPFYRSLPFEESESDKYKYLVDLMKYQKDNGGHIVWVMGPAVVFNHDTRIALEELARKGYVNAVLAGNALATHDLEGGYLNTALGQNIYTQESVPNGHYNHLDTINECTRLNTIEEFVKSGEVKDGFMKVLVEENIPFILAGSIRDDGPLPGVYHHVQDAIHNMTEELKKATLVINLATLLHSVAASSMLSGYRVVDDRVEPVFVYTVDITSYTEDSVAKVRWDFLAKSMVTNVQDFVTIIKKMLDEKGD